jgi:hypothetical protein
MDGLLAFSIECMFETLAGDPTPLTGGWVLGTEFVFLFEGATVDCCILCIESPGLEATEG